MSQNESSDPDLFQFFESKKPEIVSNKLPISISRVAPTSISRVPSISRVVPRTQGWYWQVFGEDYKRSSVEDIEQFCGWNTLLRLVKECELTPYSLSPKWENTAKTMEQDFLRERDQAFISTSFLTGGRVQEVLELRKESFEFQPQFVVVSGMICLKKWHRDKETGKVVKDKKLRGRFCFPRAEPIVSFLEKWVSDLEKNALLFPSPRNPEMTLTKFRAYQIVTRIGKRCGLKIWPHWFRAQRASQLIQEYHFDTLELQKWFSWDDPKSTSRYGRLSTDAFEAKMNAHI